MSDTLRMQLDLQGNLEKRIENSTKEMKGFNSVLEKASDKFEGLAKGFSKLKGTISSIVPVVGGVFSVSIFADSVKQVLEMDKAMTQLSHRMGQGAEGVQTLKDAVYDTNAALGIGIDNASELVTTLTEMRVPLNMMQGLTEATGMFSELTGASAGQSAELAGSLVTVGRMGEEATTSIMSGIVQVQREVGFTTNEVDTLSNSLMSSTQMLNTMGKSAAEIEDFNSGVVQLAGAFASVGIEANKATQLIDDMLDPSKIEDNAFLLSQLGVSMEDAFSGDLDPAKLAEGFRDIGMSMQNMSGPAAAAMAEEMGMSVRDLRQMGEMSTDQMNAVADAMAGGASGAEAMAAAFEDEATPLMKLERGMEKIKGFLGEMVDSLLPYIESAFTWLADNAGLIREKIGGFIDRLKEMGPNIMKFIPILIAGIIGFFVLMRRRFRTTATEASEYLQTGVAEGIEQGARKGTQALTEQISGKEMDLRFRTEGGMGFKQMNAEAELMEARAEIMSGPFKSVVEKTAAINRNLSYSTKPLSSLGQKAAAMAVSNQERLEHAKNERSIIESSSRALENQYSTDLNILNTRKSKLETQEELTAAEQFELKALEKATDRLSAKETNRYKEQQRFIEHNAAQQRRAYEAMSNDQLINIGIEENARKAQAQSRMSDIQDEINKGEQRAQAFQSAESQLKKMLNKRQISQADYLEKSDLLKQKLEAQVQANARNNSELQQQQSIVDGIENSMTAVNNVAEKRGLDLVEGAKQIDGMISPLTKIGNVITQAGRNTKRSLMDAGSNLVFSAGEAARSFASRFKKENIGATLRGGARRVAGAAGRGARAAGRGAMGALGGIGKLLGPIGLIAGILTNMEPVQKMIGRVMEKIKGPLESVAEKLIPLFERVFSMLMPIVEQIMDTLMPIIEDLINSLMPVIDQLTASLLPIFQQLFRALMPLVNVLLQSIGPVITSILGALMPLINFLLPPLIWVLGAVLEVAGKIIETVWDLIKFLVTLPLMIEAAVRPRKSFEQLMEERNVAQENALYRVADTMGQVGAELSSAGREMRNTAFEPVEVQTEPLADAIEEGVGTGVADGMATSETRRTWTPAELRASESGISLQNEGIQEVTTTTGSAEQTTSDNTARIAENSTEQMEALQQQVRMLEQDLQRSEERHEELVATLRSLRQDTGGPNLSPVSGGL